MCVISLGVSFKDLSVQYFHCPVFVVFNVVLCFNANFTKRNLYICCICGFCQIFDKRYRH